MELSPVDTEQFCSVEGCHNSKFQRGWCQKHYTRQYRYGNFDTVLKPYEKETFSFVATVADLAWAAGFIDGEGAVMISWSRAQLINRRGRSEVKGDQFYVHLRVSQACLPPLIKLQDLFGGDTKALDMSMPARIKNRRPMYEWNVFGRRAVAVLEAIKPYMMVKQEHALLAVEFDNECFGSTDNFETRKAYFDLMAELQHKGQHLKKEVE